MASQTASASSLSREPRGDVFVEACKAVIDRDMAIGIGVVAVVDTFAVLLAFSIGLQRYLRVRGRRGLPGSPCSQ